MKLYHGSEKIVETPQFGTGNPRNDYGLGFYCTQNLELAKEWACQRNTDGYASDFLSVQDVIYLIDIFRNPELLHGIEL